MDGNQKKYIGRLEINDLIDDAVNNAVARRSLGTNSEDALSALSYDEAARIAGGLTTGTFLADKSCLSADSTWDTFTSSTKSADIISH